MNPELPKQLTEEEIEKMRKGVDRIMEPGQKPEASYIYDLAKDEDDWREKLKESEKNVYLDPLTDIYNKRAFYEKLPQLVLAEAREKKDFSVLVMDLDDFGKINKEYGMQSGDQMLFQIAKILEGSIRESDFLCRYGGEEFVIFLPNTDIEGATFLAEKIREFIENHKFIIKDNGNKETILKKTISIGCADSKQLDSLNDGAEEILEKLVSYANEAQIESKNKGKNRVTSYDKESNLEINKSDEN